MKNKKKNHSLYTATYVHAQELFRPLGEIETLEGIKEGVENTNYLVNLTDSKKYILTIFEKRTKEVDLPYFNNLMKLFYDNNISCPLSVTIDNKNLFKIKGKPCCIYTFVEGRPLKDINNQQLKSLGKSIADLHQAGNSSKLFRKNMMFLPTSKYITKNISNLTLKLIRSLKLS